MSEANNITFNSYSKLCTKTKYTRCPLLNKQFTGLEWLWEHVFGPEDVEQLLLYLIIEAVDDLVFLLLQLAQFIVRLLSIWRKLVNLQRLFPLLWQKPSS